MLLMLLAEPGRHLVLAVLEPLPTIRVCETSSRAGASSGEGAPGTTASSTAFIRFSDAVES
jgi:hypothetical protein